MITEQQSRWAFVECSVPPSGNQNYVCLNKKQIGMWIVDLVPFGEIIMSNIIPVNNTETIVSRHCFCELPGAAKNACMSTFTPSYIKQVV